MKILSLLMIVFIVLVPVTSCAEKSEHPVRSLSEIKSNAENYLLKNKQKELTLYDLKDISYSYTRETWTLMYESKTLAIGDHFFLVIKKNEDAVDYVPVL